MIGVFETCLTITMGVAVGFVIAKLFPESRNKQRVVNLLSTFQAFQAQIERRIQGLLDREQEEQKRRADARRDYRDKMENLHTRLDRHEAAFGGLWKTAQGHTVQVRDMSDGHLANCIEYVKTHPSFFPMGKSEKLIEMFQTEQERRRIDREWEGKNRTFKPDGTVIPHGMFARTQPASDADVKADIKLQLATSSKLHTLEANINGLETSIIDAHSRIDDVVKDIDALVHLRAKDMKVASKAGPKKGKK